MVLSHEMMGQVGTTISCCLVSCLHLRAAGQSSYGVLSRQSSQWLKNLKKKLKMLTGMKLCFLLRLMEKG